MGKELSSSEVSGSFSRQGNTAPSQASQPTTVQGTSQKGKAAEQSNQPGTSKGTKAVPSKPFQGKGGNVPKPGQKPNPQGNRQRK